MADTERLARRAAGGDLNAARRLVEALERQLGGQEDLVASARSKLRDGEAGSITIDELVALRVADSAMADEALKRLHGKPAGPKIDGRTEFRPAVCPTCSRVPRGEVNTVEAIAEFEGGRFEYSGWTQNTWETQRVVVGPRGGRVVTCSEGHQWEVFAVTPPGAA